MMGILKLIGGPVVDLLEKVIPDPKARDAAKLELLKLQQEGRLQDVEAQLSAIIAEANSSDPWTSRARPSFLYMCYVLILASIPMGFLSAISPETAQAVVAGFKGWLEAIPEEIVTLMGVGYLGYTGARTWDKSKGSPR